MKRLSLVILTLFVVLTLSACFKQKDEEVYKTTYVGQYDTLNYLYSSSASDSDLFANFVDGLVENDNYGKIIPSLATEFTNDPNDPTIWTFKIRQGVKWVDRNGKEYGEVTAQNWIDAAKYILNPKNNSQVITLWQLFIKNATNYYCSLQVDQAAEAGDPVPSCSKSSSFVKNSDFSSVGVKALDDYTLQYTLVKPAPYFLTALTYNPFWPVNGEYLRSQGTNFGFDGDYILYNGAYVMDEDQTNAIESMKANPKYWDKDNVHIEKIRFIYIPGDAGYDWARLKYENNELTGFRIQENDTVGWEKYISGKCTNNVCEGTKDNPVNPDAYTIDSPSKFTYYMQWNWGRDSFSGSKLSDTQHDNTNLAIQNSNFRLGFLWGIHRETFLATYTAGNPSQYIRNSYNPRELATDQNGIDYIDYLAKEYSEQENISLADALDFFKDGAKDSRFDEAKALAYFQAAKAELIAAGLTEADFPIHVETVAANSAKRLPYYQAAIDEFNDAFSDIVKFDLLIPASDDEWTLWASEELSYDIRWFMGWGPDYADPTTYLNTFVVNGDMLDYSKLVGKEELQQQLLGDYTELVEAGDAIYKQDELDKRFEKFAEAEYYLVYEQALVIPFFSPGGVDVYVSKEQPYVAGKAPYGLSGSKFKYRKVLDEAITREQRQQLKQEYEANRP